MELKSIDRRTLLELGVFSCAAYCSRTLVAQPMPAAGGQRNGANSPVNQQSESGVQPMENELKITPFLMFVGRAEEAMNFYVSLFDNSKTVEIMRYGPNEAGKEGSIMRALFSLNGQEIMCIDSPIEHEFTFTPATSLFVTCADAARITRYYEALVEGGQTLMPLDEYPFSKKFAWVQDKFGVSWQLSVT